MSAHLILVENGVTSRSEREIALWAALNADQGFREGGYVAFGGDPTGVAIERAGHFRGVWSFAEGQFAWTPAGYAEPVHTSGNVAEAVSHTLHAIGCA